MMKYANKYVIYGLKNYKEVIAAVIRDLCAQSYEFDIKLILTEAISNAFYHGNNGNEDLPICIRYLLHNGLVTFEIEDCCKVRDKFVLPNAMEQLDPFQESNRGLFLIECYADKIEFQEGKLIIEKTIKAT